MNIADIKSWIGVGHVRDEHVVPVVVDGLEVEKRALIGAQHLTNDLKSAGLFFAEILIGKNLNTLLLPYLPLCSKLKQRQVAQSL